MRIKRLSLPCVGVLVLLLVHFSGCRLVRMHVDGESVQRNICFQGQLREQYSAIETLVPQEEIKEDTELNERFSSKALLVANARGVIPLLRRYVQAEKQISDEDTSMNYLRYMAIRQELYQKIMLANLDVSSINAEIECERERTRGLAEYMNNRQNTRRQRYTLAALALGAAITVSSSIVDLTSDSGADDIISLSGGMVEVVLSLLSSTYRLTATFKHSPNLLKEVWENPEEPELYPPFVWVMMHQEDRLTDDISAHLIDDLIEGWKAANLFTEDEEEEEQEKSTRLLFGEGGEYSIDKLEAREEMLNQLQAAIGLIQQDINRLLREIDQR